MKLESINEPAHSLRIIRRRRMCLTNGKVKRSKHIAIERSTSSARTMQQQPHAAQPASIAFHASKTCAISLDRMRHSLRRSDQEGAGGAGVCGGVIMGCPFFPRHQKEVGFQAHGTLLPRTLEWWCFQSLSTQKPDLQR